MQKVLAVLEQYVQWFALTLACLFLMFMVWTYVFNNPAQIQVGKTTYTPANVDPLIANNQVKDLSELLNKTGDLPDIRFKPVAMEPEQALFRPTTRPTTRDAVMLAWDSHVLDLSANVKPPAPSQGELVSNLPPSPPVTYLQTEFLRTTVLDATTQAHVDKDTITTFWQLPVRKLQEEYAQDFGQRLPENAQTTLILNATLVRQEQTDAGWGPDVIVPRLGYLPPMPAYPPKNADDEKQYREWAKANARSIASPDFFAPAYPARADLQWRTLTDWVQWDAQQQAANAANQAAALAPPPRIAPPPTPAPTRGGRGAATPPPVAFIPPTPVQPATPVAPPLNVAAVPDLAGLPPGPFSPTPRGLTQDVLTWMIDDGVVPGKTYRYKVRYTLLNPLYGYTSKVSDPKMADQLGVDSVDSDWSVPTSVPVKTHYWVAAKQPLESRDRPFQTQFDVYAWHDGSWRYKPFMAVPGDEIGEDAGDDGDYTSHHTLLDVKDDRNSPRMISTVNDFTGQSVLHDAVTDERAADYRAFQIIFTAQSAPPTSDAGQVSPFAATAAAPMAGF